MTPNRPLYYFDEEDACYFQATKDELAEILGLEDEKAVTAENTLSDYARGQQEGFSEGFDHAKAEALIAIVKAVSAL